MLLGWAAYSVGKHIPFFSFQDVYLQILNVTLKLPMFSSFECCVVSLKSVVFFMFVFRANPCYRQINFFLIYFARSVLYNGFVR